MVKLMKLMKAVMGTALLSKALKSILTAALLRSANGTSRASAVSMADELTDALTNLGRNGSRSGYLQALLKGALAFALLRSMNGSGVGVTGAGVKQPGMISTLSALLATIMRSMERQHDDSGRVIDVDDFTIVDEK